MTLMSDFTNINDPEGVTALLESLRKSQAWQELDAQNTANRKHEFHAPKVPDDITSKIVRGPPSAEVEYAGKASEPSSNILSLLARLEPADPVTIKPTEAANTNHIINPSKVIPHIPRYTDHDVSTLRSDKPPKPSPASVRNMNFTQALPIIANLASNDSVLQRLKKIREQQNSTERQLWEERNQIIKSQEEKIRVAQTKAAIIGVDMSEKEVQSLQASFIEDLRKFDLERILPAWDSLVASQQRALEEIGVPGIFPTKNKMEREKQQRIIQVLEGLAGPDNNADDHFEEEA